MDGAIAPEPEMEEMEMIHMDEVDGEEYAFTSISFDLDFESTDKNALEATIRDTIKEEIKVIKFSPGSVVATMGFTDPDAA
jgi:hypothetical protein